MHAPGAEGEQLSSTARGQSPPIGSEGSALGQGYLSPYLPASFLPLFLMLARRGCMVRRHLVVGLLALAHGVAANRDLPLPSPPSPSSHGGRRDSGSAPPPSPPPHLPCSCQHVSVTGAESVQSKRMGIYTRTDDFIGARQLYQRGSPASQYLYYDTRCAHAANVVSF